MTERALNLNLSAPNLICVCVDSKEEDNPIGRFYDRLHAQPTEFKGVETLLVKMDALFDELNYPQAATVLRNFEERPRRRQQTERSGSERRMPVDRKQLLPAENIVTQRGRAATFVVAVYYRQNSSWQGRVVWMEQGKAQDFDSALDFLKLMYSAFN